MDYHEVAADEAGTTDDSEIRLLVVQDGHSLSRRPISSQRLDPVADHCHAERIGVRLQEPSDCALEEDGPRAAQ